MPFYKHHQLHWFARRPSCWGICMYTPMSCSTKATSTSIPTTGVAGSSETSVGCHEITGVKLQSPLTEPQMSQSYLHPSAGCQPSATLYHLGPTEYCLWMWSLGSCNLLKSKTYALPAYFRNSPKAIYLACSQTHWYCPVLVNWNFAG